MSPPPPSPHLIVESLHEESEHLISACTQHPFLAELLDGSLKPATFKRYIVQDALYLRSFDEALRLLGSRDARITTGMTNFADNIKKSEVALHEDYLKKWEVELAEVEPNMTTLLYTSYVLSVCARRPTVEGLAVLLPCFSVYEIVGREMISKRNELRRKNPNKTNPYDSWIDLYGDPTFSQEVADFKATVESICLQDNLPFSSYSRHFSRCCKMEHMFWTAASTGADSLAKEPKSATNASSFFCFDYTTFGASEDEPDNRSHSDTKSVDTEEVDYVSISSASGASETQSGESGIYSASDSDDKSSGTGNSSQSTNLTDNTSNEVSNGSKDIGAVAGKKSTLASSSAATATATAASTATATATTTATATATLAKGDQVELRNCTMASMNGKIGTVVAPAGDDGRVKVSLEEVNQEIAVMPEKLKNTKIKDDGTKVKKRFWPRRRNKSKLATDNLNLARAQL